MPNFYGCNACEDIPCGPTPDGVRFFYEMFRASVHEMWREQEQEDERWCGVKAFMGHDAY
jgi:hypothetical protein